MKKAFFCAVAFAAALVLVPAPPAAAKLGDTINEFRRSELIKGDDLFKFDGRIGARYRFSGATRCRFGSGLLMVDTVDGVIVQETIVLPLPGNVHERHTLEGIVELYIKDLGLEKEDAELVRKCFQEGIQGGKTQVKPLGPALKQRYQLNVYTNPSLHSILLMVGLVNQG